MTLALWLPLAACSSVEAPQPAPPDRPSVIPLPPAAAPPAPAPDDDADRGDERIAGSLGLERFELTTANGERRSAWIKRPERGRGPYPVVLAFHGGQKNDGLVMAPRFEAILDKPALFVFPNGRDDNPNQIGWVGPGIPVEDPLSDVKFVRALVDELGKAVTIDRSRIYAVGFSNGGFMTHTLFCEANDLFAAFSMVARPISEAVTKDCATAPPKPVLLAAGTDDDHLVNDHDLSVDATVAWYGKKLGCANKSAAKDTLPDTGDETVVRHTRWDRCDGGATFEFYEIDGGGHFWPGPRGRAIKGRSRDLDATAEVARFFRL